MIVSEKKKKLYTTFHITSIDHIKKLNYTIEAFFQVFIY